MSLETGTYVSDLVASNPASSDFTSQGDDHLRLIKSLLQATLPNASKAFRFPTDVANKTGNYTLVFPDDQNKYIPFDTSGGNYTVTLPAMSGVNANGWECTIVKGSADTNTVTILGTINGATDYVIRKQFDAVRLIYRAAASIWVALPLMKEFVSGTKLIFAQTSAPTGWTKETNAAYNNAALRNVTGSVTPTGGANNFTSVLTARTIALANLPNTNLTSNTDGSHTHDVKYNVAGDTSTSGGGFRATTIIGTGTNTGAAAANTTGSAHSHTVPLGGSGTAMDFDIKYVDTILATKV